MQHSFLIALQFLTRLPVNFSFDYSSQRLGQSPLFYPAIGLLIGLTLATLAQLLPEQQPALNAALMLTFWVLITGGLHLDGLADCSDAWAGGLNDKARTLKIMKEPTAGPIAIIFLVLLLLLKWTSLQSILGQTNQLIPLLLAPVLGRVSILLLMLSSPYVSTKGLAATLFDHLPKQAALLSSISLILICIWFAGITVIAPSLLLIALIRYLSMQRIQGVTGDVYGASVELTEACLLVSWVLFYE
ncbi:MAG: adenosylcobinamide-GDP ribazoletransferase [Methyloprofundus sp.]|nr:adenosylcobinamide-GDP ribazoletransferase [Methyloprofundus sp.]